MKYRSTRGSLKLLSFSEAVLVGLAEDGGLFIPTNIPALPENWRKDWSNLTFNSLALEIFSLYIPTEEISRKELEQLINKSYSTFRSNEITPLKKIRENFYVLELFHGPTFAFKDVALQFLGNLFEYLLEKKNEEKENKDRITVLGATSGDTGSAAIYGLRGKKNISVFILHPHGKISPIQEAQMTTVLDKNVHNLSVEGTFDDCQDIVKNLFASTNSNDILDRFFKNGRYEKLKSESGKFVKETLSPAMDIAISSNFERLLWYLAYKDSKVQEEDKIKEVSKIVRGWMEDVKTNKSLKVEKSMLDIALRDFKSEKVSDQETLSTIQKYYTPENKDQISYILDPHTAVGVAAADRQIISPNTIQICLATAHPAKFSQAVEKALENFKAFKFESIFPKEFVGLLEKEKKVIFVEKADPSLVKKVIENELDIELNSG